MSTTAQVAAPTEGFADPHELVPRRFSHLLEIVTLIAVLAGDAVAFQALVAVAMDQSSGYLIWTLIAALSAAATLSMHLAGVARRRRQVGLHQAGRLWAWCLVLCWLALGGMAFWFRLAAAAAHDGPAATSSVFGAAPALGAATEIPMAALLLGLYLVGGIAAYGIGYKLHNPARDAYFRARRELRRALGAQRRATRRYGRAVARNARPTSGWLSQRVLALVTPRPYLSQAQPRYHDISTDPQLSGGAIDELARREQVVARARAQADQLREVARHRLAAALAEPARTSGVFDGHQHLAEQPHTDVFQGAQ